MNRRRSDLRREDGFSLVELLVAMSMGTVVLLGVFAVVQASSHSSSRTTARVRADQSARPVLVRIIDELHSSCVGAGVAPILPGSNDDSLSFVYSIESAADGSVSVSPVPVKRTITLSAGTMNEIEYAAAPGATGPAWTFASTPTPNSARQLLTGVGQAKATATVSLPLFRYYAYDSSGQISTTPLGTPLSAADAARTVKVDVAFAVIPPKNTVAADPGATVSLSDSALMRFSPAGATSAENLPCL